jgi:hypothetical protein
MRDRFRAYVAKLPPADAAGWGARAEPLGFEGYVLVSLHDWAELDRVDRQLVAVYDDAIRQTPNAAWIMQARLYRIGAQAWIALARLRTGHAAEAVTILEPLSAQLAAVPQDPNWVEHRQEVTDFVSTTLGEALLEMGDRVRARSVLEDCLQSREAGRARQPNNWWYQAGLAETCTLLARTFDSAKPEEAVRRKELLDHAAAILAKGEAEGQLTNDNKELQAKVAVLLAPKD